jgi:hypothetical protein
MVPRKVKSRLSWRVAMARKPALVVARSTTTRGKPQIDRDDPAARDELIDSRAPVGRRGRWPMTPAMPSGLHSERIGEPPGWGTHTRSSRDFVRDCVEMPDPLD